MLRNANKTDVLLLVRSWYDEIAKNIDLYLSVPKIMSLASQVFKLNRKNCEKDETFTAAATSSAQKIISLREFISLSNAEFNTCSDTCSGVEKCDCITREWERFDFHFKANFEPSEGIIVQFKGNSESPINYVKAFSFYLNENGYHKELNCTNIVRVLEQISLMKPSQSGTERVMSYVANTVKNRFESKLQFKPNEVTRHR